MSYSDPIHAAMLARVAATTFYAVTYNAAHVRTTSSTVLVSPGSVFFQPETASFDLPAENRRKYERERVDWIWILDLGFSKRVDLEAFESSLVDDPLVIPRAAGRDRLVILELQDVTYEVPPLGQNASGTRARLRLTAALSPK